MRIAIIGAGIGGLALARALQARDHDVCVYDEVDWFAVLVSETDFDSRTLVAKAGKIMSELNGAGRQRGAGACDELAPGQGDGGSTESPFQVVDEHPLTARPYRLDKLAGTRSHPDSIGPGRKARP